MTNELTHAAVRSLLSVDRELPIDYRNASQSGRLSVRRNPTIPEPDAIVQISPAALNRQRVEGAKRNQLNVNIQNQEVPSFKDALAEILKVQHDLT